MVFLNMGFKVYLHKGLVHTPLWVNEILPPVFLLMVVVSVPFSVSKLNAACGVMITGPYHIFNRQCGAKCTILLCLSASHNPKVNSLCKKICCSG